MLVTYPLLTKLVKSTRQKRMRNGKIYLKNRRVNYEMLEYVPAPLTLRTKRSDQVVAGVEITPAKKTTKNKKFKSIPQDLLGCGKKCNLVDEVE